jgi:hypothetical protein
MQFDAHLEKDLERRLQEFILILRKAVCIAILDITWCARIDGILVRCARNDGFLMPNDRNSDEKHSVRMQELKVG